MVSIIISLFFSHCSNSIQLAFPIFLIVNYFLRLRPHGPSSPALGSIGRDIARAIFRACALVNWIKLRCTLLVLFTEFAVFSYLKTVYFIELNIMLFVVITLLKTNVNSCLLWKNMKSTHFMCNVFSVFRKKII